MSDMGNHIICRGCGVERLPGQCRKCANIRQQKRRDALKTICPVCEARYMHKDSTKCRACNMRECANHIGLRYAPEGSDGVKPKEQPKPVEKPEAIRLGRSLREDLAEEIASNICPKRAAWIAKVTKHPAVKESDSVAVGA